VQCESELGVAHARKLERLWCRGPDSARLILPLAHSTSGSRHIDPAAKYEALRSVKGQERRTNCAELNSYALSWSGGAPGAHRVRQSSRYIGWSGQQLASGK